MAGLSASDKLRYWITVRGTIQKFDDILTKLSFQGLTLLAGALSVTGYLFLQRLMLIAMLVSGGIILVGITLAFHTWLYFRLLEKAVETAIQIEDEMFPSAPREVKLTANLKKVPGKKSFPILIFVHVAIIIIAAILLIAGISQSIPNVPN